MLWAAAIVGVVGALGCSGSGNGGGEGQQEGSPPASSSGGVSGGPGQASAGNAMPGGSTSVSNSGAPTGSNASPNSSTSTSGTSSGGSPPASTAASGGEPTTPPSTDASAGGGAPGTTAAGGASMSGSEPAVALGGSPAAGGSAGGMETDPGTEPAGGVGGVSGGTGGTSGSGAGGADNGSEPPIIDLFNGTDLTGWTAYRETSKTSPGTQLSDSDAEAIFKPEDGTIRVYGDAPDQSEQSRHTLLSDESYSKYILTLEYRWGTKKFAPYTDLTQYPRDAGVLWHIHGDLTQVWPSSIEFQIKDGTTGDIFALYARCTSLARNGGTTFVDADQGGTEKVVDGADGYVQHSRSENLEVDGWNSIELQVDGGTAVYLVNGQVVNRVLSVNDRSGSTGSPVTSGPIALQAEHAEVFYRNIRIQVLP